jgi:copper chaperone CopZ
MGYNARMTAVNLNIAGMSCGNCVAHVKRALSAVPGVTVRNVEIGQAEVELNSPADLRQVVAAVHDAGYEAQPAS